MNRHLDEETGPGAATPEETATGELDGLLDRLAGPDGMDRRRARERIVALGPAAVPGLIARLEHGAFRLRWEAAKALGAIGDPAATAPLLVALRDRDQDVRWLAAEALAAIGRPGAEAVIAMLVDHCASGWVRQGVHHVLHEYGDPRLRDATSALQATLGRAADDADVINAAEEALAALRDGGTARSAAGAG